MENPVYNPNTYSVRFFINGSKKIMGQNRGSKYFNKTLTRTYMYMVGN